MVRFRYRTGDITTVEADVIVNAANSAMRGGGGVDGAIHRAGGPAILEDCIRRFPDGLATGDAGWTTGGELPARWVIHTVGPNHNAGQRDRSLLVSCYRRCLQVADELGARTIAFPLISAGVYGWPKADAIDAAVGTIMRTETQHVEEATLVLLSSPGDTSDPSWTVHYAIEKYAARGAATPEHLTWAASYNAYERIAAGPSELRALLDPALTEYAETGVVPAWCGVDLLRAWAFWELRSDHHQGGGSLGSTWADVLDAVRAHPKARPTDLPPDNVELP